MEREEREREETEELNLMLLFTSRLGLYDQNVISAMCIEGTGLNMATEMRYTAN